MYTTDSQDPNYSLVITFNSVMLYYAGEVLLKLNRPRARSRGEKGNARVQFEISPDGSVAWVRILSSNGSAKLERDAAAAVRRAAPFPLPPNGTTRRFVFVYRSQ